MSGAANRRPNSGPSSVQTAAAPIVAVMRPKLRTADSEPNADQRSSSGAICATPTCSPASIAPLAKPAPAKHTASSSTVPSTNAKPA